MADWSSTLKIKELCTKYIAVGLLLVGLFGNPALTASKRNPSHVELWKNPCSYHTARHGRSAVGRQIRTNIYIINETLNELKKLYPQALELKKTSRMKMRMNKCPKLGKLLKPKKNATNTNEAYMHFYQALYTMAVFSDTLKNITLQTKIPFDSKSREQLYASAYNIIKIGLCEIYDNTTSVRENTQFKIPKVKTHCIPPSPQLNMQQVMDIQFFLKLKKVFTQGNRLISRKGKKGNKNRTNSNSSS